MACEALILPLSWPEAATAFCTFLVSVLVLSYTRVSFCALRFQVADRTPETDLAAFSMRGLHISLQFPFTGISVFTVLACIAVLMAATVNIVKITFFIFLLY